MQEGQQELERLRAAEEDALLQMSKAWTPETRSHFWRIREFVLEKERELCALQGTEHAVESPIQLGKQGLNTEDCLLMSNHFSCGFVYGRDDYGYCILFKLHEGVRLESINDEVHSGHPLTGRGLGHYDAYIIQNSEWVRTLSKIQSVHDQYSQTFWDSVEHHLFLFRERIIEVLSKDKPEIHGFDSLAQATEFLLTHKKIIGDFSLSSDSEPVRPLRPSSQRSV
jgi:hypothetical protein